MPASIAEDIYLFIAKQYETNALIFTRGDDALLIDTTANAEDGAALRHYVENELGKTVRFIVLTHYFSDHIAGAKQFPGAEIVTHEFYAHTFDSEHFREATTFQNFVRPTMLIASTLTWHWGRYTLRIFHNPGHTLGTLNVEIPEADLLHVSDNVVGRLIYLGYNAADLVQRAVREARQRGRGRIVASHGGVRPADDLSSALRYADRLEKTVRSLRSRGAGSEDILNVDVQKCFDEGAEATEFERLYHQRNLACIVDREMFRVPA